MIKQIEITEASPEVNKEYLPESYPKDGFYLITMTNEQWVVCCYTQNGFRSVFGLGRLQDIPFSDGNKTESITPKTSVINEEFTLRLVALLANKEKYSEIK